MKSCVLYFLFLESIANICIHLQETENNPLCVCTFMCMYFGRCFCMHVETMRMNQGKELILQFLINMVHNNFIFLHVVSSLIFFWFQWMYSVLYSENFSFTTSPFQGNGAIVENHHAWEGKKGKGGKSPPGVLKCQETADEWGTVHTGSR